MRRMLAERAAPRDGRERGMERRRAARSVTVNLAESPLGWLAARGMISARQLDAGEALRRDFELARLGPSVTMRWDAAPRSRAERATPVARDPTTAQIDAKRRFEAAIAAAGAGLDGILWRVVCAGEGLSHAEGALGWPGRAGKVVLGIALDRLAEHYRLPG